MNEWKEITDPEELFRLKREGWEIQTDAGTNTFAEWVGENWYARWYFRGRPRQPAMKKVKLEAWLSEYELRWLNVEAGNKPAPLWIRVQSEDKTVEVPA